MLLTKLSNVLNKHELIISVIHLKTETILLFVLILLISHLYGFIFH